jgi:hypothetical protein
VARPASPPIPKNPLAAAPEADPACVALAADVNVTFETLPAAPDGACSLATPIKISAIRLRDGGTVAIEPAATMRCATALAVVGWVRDVVVPAAKTHLGGPVTAVKNAASYECRGRNRVQGAKLSEHGKGNALDIGAFKPASGDWIEVREPGKAAAFLNEVRAKACGPFTTVLGPGSDPYHSDHLHLDIARRGKTGRSLYCK